MDEPRSISVLRAALLKLGLSDGEVERFLAKLGSDLTKGVSEEEIRRICEEFVTALPKVDERFGDKSTLGWRMTKIIAGGITLGVLAELVADLIKAGFAKLTVGEISSPEELVLPGGWNVVRKVPDGTALGDSEPTCRIKGLRDARRRLRLAASHVAAACSVSRKTYGLAERGEPVSRTVAEKLKAGLVVLAQLHGEYVWYAERRKTERLPSDAEPDELMFICQ